MATRIIKISCSSFMSKIRRQIRKNQNSGENKEIGIKGGKEQKDRRNGSSRSPLKTEAIKGGEIKPENRAKFSLDLPLIIILKKSDKMIAGRASLEKKGIIKEIKIAAHKGAKELINTRGKISDSAL
ncbi:MAG: hypothetical protein N2445_03275 [Acidobacteria bacterium]|nr:hypothetical protein [Acidobacteriota bacterium]